MEDELMVFEQDSITNFIQENAETLESIMKRNGGSVTDTIISMLDEQIEMEEVKLEMA